MSYLKKTLNKEENSIIWPGFVDVLASTLMVIIFVVLLFTVSQVYLGDLVIGKNEQIQQLEETIDIQDETIVFQDEEIVTKETTLFDKEKIISQMDSELLLLDEEISIKQNLINEKELVITDQDKQISSKNEAILNLDQLVENQALDINALNKIIDQITNELSLSLSENKKMQETLITLQTEQNKLLNSMSIKEEENTKLMSTIQTSQTRIASLINQLSSSKDNNIFLENKISGMKLENELMNQQLIKTDNKTLSTESSLNEALLKIANLSDDVKILTNEIQTLNNILDAKEAEITNSKIELGEIGDRLNRVLTSEIFQLQKYRSEFFGRLKEIIGDKAEIKVQGDRFIFQSEILFDSGSSLIQPSGVKTLASVAKTIEELIDEIPSDLNWILQVDGHTDKIPIFTSKFPSNWELSHARALEVLKFFVSQGIPPSRLSANGYGDNHPIAFGNTQDDYKANRRIELKITER